MTGSPSPNHNAPIIRNLALPAAMLAVFFIAIYVRLNLLVMRGGLQSDQLGWAFQTYYGGISVTYMHMRDALLAGRAEPGLWSYLPGYPALLAVFDLLGIKDLRTVRTAQTVLDAASVAPLFYVVNHLTRSRTLAVFAAGIYAVSPWWALGASYLLSESLMPALVICALAGMIWTREHPQHGLGCAGLGVFCAILPFFRSEMILLIGPLICWALIVALPGRRVSSVAIVGTAFAVPLLAWCLRNYLMHGQFALVPPVHWYAMWSGLGQVPNDFGYFVSDQRAQELLQSKGFSWHSLQAEAFWKSEYFRAWRDHPLHILQSILFRLRYTLSYCDYGFAPFRELCSVFYRWFAWISLLATLWLLWKRRWPEVFLVTGPMLYALASLGFIYVEPRYVRYAGLTYLLGFSIFLALIAEAISQSKALNPFRFSQSRIKFGTGVAGLAVIAMFVVSQQARLQEAGYRGLVSAAPDPVDLEAYPPHATIQSVAFQQAVPTASATLGPAGLDVRATAPTSSYLLTAALGQTKADAAAIRYRVKLVEGGLAIGVLSRDQSVFLAYQTIFGPPNSIQSSAFRTAIEQDSLIVITAENPTPRGSRFEIQNLEVRLLCMKGHTGSALSYMFRRPMPRMGSCDPGNG